MSARVEQATTAAPAAPTFTETRERIARIPRVPIAIRPTPMIEAPNLARALGGPRVFVKRDDLTGVALGGNKLRNLEFRLARTLAERPDVVLVGLDLQSNSARQTVGACNRLGLETTLVLEGARPEEVQGNLLVDYLLGAEVHFAADRQEQRATLDRLAEECRRRGRRPHILNDNPMFDVASAIAYLETTPRRRAGRGTSASGRVGSAASSGSMAGRATTSSSCPRTCTTSRRRPRR